MKQTRKKKFNFPTGANTDGEINVHGGIKENHPLNTQNDFPGDAVQAHKELEAANEVIAEKEISQTYHNS